MFLLEFGVYFFRPPAKSATPQPSNKKDLTVSDSFDVYIDFVQNIPDNATIIKVLPCSTVIP